MQKVRAIVFRVAQVVGVIVAIAIASGAENSW